MAIGRAASFRLWRSASTTRSDLMAFNDIAIVRDGDGQVRASVKVDGTLYARLAGDGCVVSTPVGSSAYSFAAGGPLLAADAQAFLLTPLSNHGGSCPPLVVAAGSTLHLEIRPAFGGVRLELDGKVNRHRLRDADHRIALPRCHSGQLPRPGVAADRTAAPEHHHRQPANPGRGRARSGTRAGLSARAVSPGG